jgi:hypothetical protein
MGCESKSSHGVHDPLVVSGDGHTVTVRGWAWSEAANVAGSAPITVKITIQEQSTFGTVLTAANNAAVAPTPGATTETVANSSRPDTVATWGAGSAPDPHHGFSVAANFSHGGKVVISAYAVSPVAGVPPMLLEQSPRCLCTGLPCSCTTSE